MTTRAVRAGEELLIDYGDRGGVSNERLCLDYGFVVPNAEASDDCHVPVADFVSALASFDEDRAAMASVDAGDLALLRELINTLVAAATDASGPQQGRKRAMVSRLSLERLL